MKSQLLALQGEVTTLRRRVQKQDQSYVELQGVLRDALEERGMCHTDLILMDARKRLGEVEGYEMFHNDIEWRSFPQVWGSTALGFGGIGGMAMTPAQTTVVSNHQMSAAAVYFAGKFCYMVINPTDMFFRCLKNGDMPSRSRASGLSQLDEPSPEKST